MSRPRHGVDMADVRRACYITEAGDVVIADFLRGLGILSDNVETIKESLPPLLF